MAVTVPLTQQEGDAGQYVLQGSVRLVGTSYRGERQEGPVEAVDVFPAGHEMDKTDTWIF